MTIDRGSDVAQSHDLEALIATEIDIQKVNLGNLIKKKKQQTFETQYKTMP